jgi:hypothetical protein
MKEKEKCGGRNGGGGRRGSFEYKGKESGWEFLLRNAQKRENVSALREEGERKSSVL